MPGPSGGVRGRNRGGIPEESPGRGRPGVPQPAPAPTTPLPGAPVHGGAVEAYFNNPTPAPTGGGGGGPVAPPVTPPPVQAPAGPPPALPAPPSPQMPAAPQTFAKPGTPGAQRFRGARMGPGFVNPGMGVQAGGAMPLSVSSALSGGLQGRRTPEEEQQTLGVLGALQGGM